ncbi:MAG: hypothetical protein IT456_11305 [Planctomycetes bacterium]|nr:hypothetical protein [Planctomycetota bacterium]
MSPTEARDRANLVAARDPAAAREMALAIKDPWFRCQALAASARYADESKVEQVAEESLMAAAECHDNYKQAAVAAWPIRALVERGRAALAWDALGRARERALAATPPSSRAEALLALLQGGWDLGASTRRQLVEDLAALHATDTFWRVGRALVNALEMLSKEDRDLARAIAERIADDRCRAKALAGIQTERACGPRKYFGP